jgi:hypothetical protein
VLLGIGTVCRLDMVVPFGTLALFWLIVEPLHRRQVLSWGAALFALFIGGQTVFRRIYYSAWLPNTYYLKMTGYPFWQRITRGLYVEANFISHLGPVPFLLPFGLLCRLRRDHAIGLPAAILMAQIIYSIYVGGDAWEFWGGSNRYVSVAMPLFFVMFGIVFAELARLVTETTLVRGLILAGITLVCLVTFNAINESTAVQELLLLEPPLLTTDRAIQIHGANLVQQITKPEAKIGVVLAGVLPYFADRETVDMLGKNDPHIARLPARQLAALYGAPSNNSWAKLIESHGWTQSIAFYPGHLKWDYSYSIGQLRPDVVYQLWLAQDDAQPNLGKEYLAFERDGQRMYLRRDSALIRWDVVGAPCTGETAAGNHSAK